ncbi:MAG: nucleotidyltransferase domain-containing protein [Thermodesulfobacteriota bacterium]
MTSKIMKGEASLQDRTVTPEAIAYICRRIVEAINPCQIVLFGSQARGEPGGGSDVDLLVVHDSPETDRQVRRQLEKLFLHRRFGLDLIVRTPEEVAKNLADGNPFYSVHIFGRGIILYQREDVPSTG